MGPTLSERQTVFEREEKQKKKRCKLNNKKTLQLHSERKIK
jgi:hypothetical protein